MASEDLERRILEQVAHRSYEPLKSKALARQLGIRAAKYGKFREVVHKLVGAGRLEFGKNRTLRVPESHGTVTGVFQRAAGGFGFVRPHLGPAGPQKDIFVAAEDAGDAASGDEVLVRITKRPSQPGKKSAGRITQIIERATHQFVGTYFEEEEHGYVRVDGTIFFQPIYVGDPGAKGARSSDKVVLEMLRFPAPGQPAEGVLTEVLGPRGAPGVDTESIIRECSLPVDFPEDALEEARAVTEQFDQGEIGDRLDLRGETLITIDPPDARDFDDAISLRHDRKGHWHLGVHIADVSHFVRPGSALDREARKRGTSVYLPNRVLPMLPEVISNGVASLQQGHVRFTKSALIEFDPKGICIDVQLASAAIKVAKRLTYEQVSSALADPAQHPPKLGSKVIAILKRTQKLAAILRQRRFERGALELHLPEVKLEFDEEGKVAGAHFVESNVSHEIVEEFMLAANEAVARHLKDQNHLFLRRVHPEPEPRKLRAFAEFAASLGLKIERPQSRPELQQVISDSVGRPEVHAVNYALLRSLKQAIYSPADEGHYALASDCYCHFTSPIRRYPDLTIHRLVEETIRAGRKKRRKARSDRPSGDEGELLALGEHCNLTERRAAQAERDLTKLKLLVYLEDRVGLELDAVITGVEEFGFFAQAKELPVDGLVHVSTLSEDYYYREEETHSLVGRRRGKRYRLGDVIRLRVARVDLDRRQLDFRVAEPQ